MHLPPNIKTAISAFTYTYKRHCNNGYHFMSTTIQLAVISFSMSSESPSNNAPTSPVLNAELRYDAHHQMACPGHGVIMGIKTLHGDKLWGQHWKVWMNMMAVCQGTSVGCEVMVKR